MTKLTIEQVTFNLGRIPGWKLAEDQMALYRTFTFFDFVTAVRFVNMLAEYVPHEDYQPEIRIAGPMVTCTLTTHQVKGLTGKDFALAQQINKLYLQS